MTHNPTAAEAPAQGAAPAEPEPQAEVGPHSPPEQVAHIAPTQFGAAAG